MTAFLTNPPLFARQTGRRKGAAFPSFRLLLLKRAMPGLLFACITLAGVSPVAGRDAPTDSQVKAAFLINFPKYVDWPEEAFAAPDSPVVIAVRENSRMAAEIQKIIRGRTVNGRKFVLKQLAEEEEPGDYHIRFISEEEQQQPLNSLSNLNGASILTVGESEDFLEWGGIINLSQRKQRIALEINLPAARQARIRISSQLLNVAKVVDTKGR